MMQPKGSLKTLILSEHRFLRSPESLTLRHSRRSRCSRLGQLSRMAFKPASVKLFAKSWRWLSLGIVSAIARASSSLSYGKRINLRRFSFSVLRLGQDRPESLRDSTESGQYENSSSSSSGSFASAFASPSFVIREHITSLRLLRLLDLQVIIVQNTEAK